MSVDIVTDKYSTAIFELGNEHQLLERLDEDLLYVKSVFQEQPELTSLLVNPLLKEEAKVSVLKQIFASSIHELALHFLCVMVERGRGRYIKETIHAYLTKSRAHRGIVEATVSVIEPLSEEMKEKLRQKLGAISGKEFMINERIDPTIIGGMVIQIGDTRIDGSVARRLEELKKSLLA